MMINKKANCIVSLFLVLIVVVVSLSSCGSKETEEAKNDSASSGNVVNLPQNSEDTDSNSKSNNSSENVVNLPQNSKDTDSDSKANNSSENVVNLPQNSEDTDSNSKSSDSSKNVVNLPQNSKDTDSNSKFNDSDKNVVNLPQTGKPSSGSGDSSKPTSGSSESSKPASGSGDSSKPVSGSNESSKPVTTHSHSYSTTVTAATCTAKGYTTYTCSCGDSYKDNYTNKAAHSWCDWYTYLEPSYTYEGIERRECIICGEIEERSIDKIEATAYYLTDADKAEIISRLIAMGDSYGLTYYPNCSGNTWDSPTPIYEEELYEGREYIINTLVDYSEGAFHLIQQDGYCLGYGLEIVEYPNTITGAYYEVYVYWV